jgi:hypothetical protein
MLRHHWFIPGTLALCLAACGAAPELAALPTADIRLTRAVPAAEILVATATRPPSPTLPQPTATPTAQPGTLEQYRVWMEQARTHHPYAETVDTMWQVMLCESSGQPDLVAGPYHGLFQYAAETWSAEWNPYRDQPILDPRAQIFATAKAWQDGHQGWWGCYSTS